MWIAAIAAAGLHACSPVDGTHIFLRDLAQVESRFAAGDPELDVGFAPDPGSRRTFFPAELARIASKAGIKPDGQGDVLYQPVCFQRRARVLQLDDLLPALKAWAPEHAQIEITEWTKTPVPEGEVIVPNPTVSNRNCKEPILLHGYVVFDGHRRAPIWMRARITAHKEIVIARAVLEAGTRSTPDQFQIEQRDVVNDWNTLPVSMEQVVGKIARKRIPEGSAVSLGDWKQPLPVEPGSSVTVDVRDGATHLEFDARAETGGAVGNTITLRNASSGKRFSARVTGENKASVTPRGADPERTK